MPQFFMTPILCVEAEDDSAATDAVYQALKGVAEIRGWS